MKKAILVAAVLLLAASSWAITPASPQATAYMQMIFVGAGGHGYITLISPEGRVTKTELTEIDMALVRGKVMLKLNGLSQKGWKVIQFQTSNDTPGFITETYLLEKP
jgi:hypothetical protein